MYGITIIIAIIYIIYITNMWYEVKQEYKPTKVIAKEEDIYHNCLVIPIEDNKTLD